ncbi:MAG: SRPBCC domain-containing protein [Acidimicrobiia bacterium]|nr:SRPBCC domain-containing protein [Acidimicrobiia bacterium]
MNKIITSTQDNVLTMERVYDAPRDLVFKAWTDANAIAQWWGPANWTTPFSKMDLREGGSWHYMMKGPDDGSEWANFESWGIFFYEKITPVSQLIYTDSFTDETGIPNKEMPNSRTVMDFIEEENKSRVISKITYVSEKELKTVLEMGMIEGTTQMFERLDEYLENVLTKG